MIAFFSAQHALHAPAYEFFRGDRVPCFESPARAELVLRELTSRGHEIRAPEVDSADTLAQVHTPRYLAFLAGAWSQWLALAPGNAEVQPFPSVWPVRTLRSDLEPVNFTARLGLYSMDNGSPLVAGTWAAAKAGADAAASAARLLRSGARGVFCATRPPGHHAGADFMAGYCFLNNAAVAAQSLRTAGGQAHQPRCLHVRLRRGGADGAGRDELQLPDLAGEAEELTAADRQGNSLAPGCAGRQCGSWA